MPININISNYEEYLLSAVDGELNAEELTALEIFLQQYPHIRQELSLLESTRIVPDKEVKFENIGLLYKPAEGISSGNYEQWLLQYVDNELFDPERKQLEQLIAGNPQIGRELALLQRARLTPDLSVTFGDKSPLYRQKSTRVRPLWWWSAAAVTVGLTVWLLPDIRQGKESGGQVAIQQPVQKQDSNLIGQHKNTISSDNGSSEGNVNLSNRNPEQNSSGMIADIEGKVVDKETSFPSRATGKTIASQKTPVIAANVNARSINKEPVAGEKHRTPDNADPILVKIPQPENTSGEVVKQLEERKIREDIVLAEANNLEVKSPVMANSERVINVPAAATAAPANVKGELVVSVTMNGDSKLLNGVANVARFLSRKKK